MPTDSDNINNSSESDICGNYFRISNRHVNFIIILCPIQHLTYTCTTDPTIKLNTLIKELQIFVTKDNQPILPYLDHVNSCLHTAVLSCRAALKIAQKVKFTEKENISPGKN